MFQRRNFRECKPLSNTKVPFEVVLKLMPIDSPHGSLLTLDLSRLLGLPWDFWSDVGGESGSPPKHGLGQLGVFLFKAAEAVPNAAASGSIKSTLATSENVQVFGFRHDDAIHALRRPASEKRQGIFEGCTGLEGMHNFGVMAQVLLTGGK